ncbi:glycoside hydrolase 43 family protein [Mucilaginibacter terrae]|uniref:glycoside hydrolase family 43 protein n=1 Tax=Mucilaginibacter terrae TaxID=1955052 RepID=UPI00362AEAFC
MFLKNFLICLFFIAFKFNVFGQENKIVQWGNWQVWGAQPNGTYQNPILPADYSDLDCIRVGNDYYAISSTFQYAPGMIVLHSKDLVNWSIIGHVISDLNQISPELNWDKMNRYGKGVWAGSIRYHDNKFWVYFGTPDEGYFMSTAPTPAGPWEPLHQMLNSKGWDDCCPFWDDDGQGYFVGTDYGNGYSIHLFKLTANGKDIIENTDLVIHQSKGSEANKLYKINGWYYHLFSEVKPEGRAIMMERSKNIMGPYNEIKQLSHAEKQFKEPNQGGLVQTQGGSWYFLTHHGSGDWSGRVMSLLPVSWKDGWPIIGEVGDDGIGRMVWTGKMPVLKTAKITPQASDDFSKSILQQQWEWNYQPRAGKWSLTENKGWLRLYAFKPLQPGNLLKAGNTLTQRVFRTSHNEAVVKINISMMAKGQRAGLAHFGSPNYASLGIINQGTSKFLEFNIKGEKVSGITVTGKYIWFKSTWGLDGISQFYYSLNGTEYVPFGSTYQLAWGSYRGDRIALYNYNDLDEAGYIDVDYFHYTY